MSQACTPYEALDKVFHEPHRLALVSSLLADEKGLSFNELRDLCDLTDGNLSRHLKVLEDAGAVRIEKSFVANRPRTTVSLTKEGRARFLEYLDALEAVLKEAASRVKKTRTKKAGAVRPNLAAT